MKIGMLWYDADLMKKGNYDTAINKAVVHYREKYKYSGKLMVYVHPTCLQETALHDVIIQVSTWMQPNYIWIGIAKENEE